MKLKNWNLDFQIQKFDKKCLECIKLIHYHH